MKKVMIVLFSILFLVGCNTDLSTKGEETQKKENKTEEVATEVDVEVEDASEASTDEDENTKSDNNNSDAVEALSVEEANYLKSHKEIVDTVNDTFDLIIEAGEAWDTGTSPQAEERLIESLEDAYEEIDALLVYSMGMLMEKEVPENMIALHSKTVDTIVLLVEAGDLHVEAVKSGMDEGLMMEWGKAMDEVLKSMDEISEELDKVN